ncbi:MAG: cytochrome c maturation protein CcmE [Acidimicrobiia bacterium]|nr:cytochrome c maturation protein CcmE [Acidimicrobiia bacterium]
MAVVDPQTPEAPEKRPPGRTQSRKRLIIVGLVVLAALGFLVVRGLGNATLYFRTADEAVAQKQQLGTKRFRIEGNVVAGTVRNAGHATAFNIESKGVVVPVSHQGDPPELFKPGIPVVLEGHFQGETFDSDRIMVKHSEDYIAQHPNRVTVPPSTVP